MKGRKALSLAAALMLALTGLTGCAKSPTEEKEESLPTLEPPTVEWIAPDGDRVRGEEGLWTLYLPGKNGLNLVAQHVASLPGLLRTEMLEAIVRELLSFPANKSSW